MFKVVSLCSDTNKNSAEAIFPKAFTNPMQHGPQREVMGGVGGELEVEELTVRGIGASVRSSMRSRGIGDCPFWLSEIGGCKWWMRSHRWSLGNLEVACMAVSGVLFPLLQPALLKVSFVQSVSCHSSHWCQQWGGRGDAAHIRNSSSTHVATES